MAPRNVKQDYSSNGNVSRRELLKQSIAFAMFHSALTTLHAAASGTRSGKILAYVGTYSTAVDGGGSNGKGIYLFEMDIASGELTQIKLAAEARNASWLSLDPSGRHLYVVNEVADFEGNSGAVSAYTVDRANGNLQLLNVVSSQGAGPAHLSVDASGKYVFVANYAGGTMAVLPILPTGALGPATDVHQDAGSLGPKIPTSAPGGFSFSGHDKPHAHMIHADPGNHFVLQTDLAQDRIYVYRLDPASGRLSPVTDPSFVAVPPGDGPRHFTFHRNGRWLYSLQEEGSTVEFFHFDPATGSLSSQQTISTLPPAFKGTNFTSEILLSLDGRFLYAANRLHDSIAIFSVNDEGRLHYLGETSTMGDYPRYIGSDPGGAFLYACNQRSDSIASFRVDRKTGMLTFTGRYTSIGSPACIIFLT